MQRAIAQNNNKLPKETLLPMMPNSNVNSLTNVLLGIPAMRLVHPFATYTREPIHNGTLIAVLDDRDLY